MLTSLSLDKGEKTVWYGDLAHGNTDYNTEYLYMLFLSIKEKVMQLSGRIWRMTIILKVKNTN